MKKIGIVIAMEEEFQAIENKIKDKKTSLKAGFSIFIVRFSSGYKKHTLCVWSQIA